MKPRFEFVMGFRENPEGRIDIALTIDGRTREFDTTRMAIDAHWHGNIRLFGLAIVAKLHFPDA